MWRRFAWMALAIALPTAGFANAAEAQGRFPCEAFVRLGDGSWQAVVTTTLPGREFSIQEGSLWRPGQVVLGIDVATTVEANCPNAPVGVPQGASVPGTPGAPLRQQPQIPQAPGVPLARYADANGNIDVRSLTCGHLDDASPEEVNLLLAWYGGNAAGKGRSINLPRLRYAMRSVIDYCKINRDKNLIKVMELMLK
jgi:hypothetical protein